MESASARKRPHISHCLISLIMLGCVYIYSADTSPGHFLKKAPQKLYGYEECTENDTA